MKNRSFTKSGPGRRHDHRSSKLQSLKTAFGIKAALQIMEAYLRGAK